MEQLSLGRSLLVGIAATGAVTAAMELTHRLEWTTLKFPRVLGTMLAEDTPASRAAGWALFVGNGGLLALAYREAARLAGAEATVLRGAAIGLLHGLVAAGGAMVLSPLHPRPLQAGLERWLERKPPVMGLAVLVGVHVLYGAVLGLAARHRPESSADAGAGTPNSSRSATRHSTSEG